MSGSTGSVPAAGKVGGGVMKLVRFVVPIGAGFGGWMTGGPIVAALATFMTDFIPGFSRIGSWVKSRSSTTDIAGMIAGIIVIAAASAIAGVVKMFIGGTFGGIIALGIAAFGIAAGLKGIVNSFGPLSTAVSTIGGTA